MRKIDRDNLVLRTIRKVLQLIVKEKDRTKLLQGICRNFIENKGYYNTWIALFDESNRLVLTAEAGLGKDFLPMIKRLEHGDLTKCCKRAIIQPEVVLTEDPVSTCRDCPLSVNYADRGALTVRLAHNEKVYGILSASIPRDFLSDKEEWALLKEIAGDIAFALHDMEIEEERKEIEERLQKHLHHLGERTKELNCLYGISELFERRNISLDEMFQGTVDLIQQAWQYPEFTCARILFEGKDFKTSNFKETIWKQSSKIIVLNGSESFVEVFYLEERSQMDEGPFLKEERNLIDAIAKRLGEAVTHKRSEEKLRNIASIVENSDDAIIGKTLDGIILSWNKSAERIYGYNEKEIKGKPISILHPPDQQDDVFGILKKIKRGQLIDFYETVRQRKDGSFIDVSLTLSPVKDGNGKIIGASTIARDITERKAAEEALRKSEQRFRDLVENSLVGISLFQNGKIIFQNSEQQRIIGPLPRPILFADLKRIHPDDLAKVTKFYDDTMSGKHRSLDLAFRFFSSSQTVNKDDMKWVYCRANTIEYQGKDAILYILMDISRAKELEHLVRIKDKMSSLGRVTAGIAHEIRNPLSGINIYLNTLKKIYDKPESLDTIKKIIDQLQSASNKIESVVRRVMDFSKPGEPKLIRTDINKPIEEALDLSAVTLRKSGIKVERELAEDLPRCQADHHMIEEVILNLITNAAEAMRRTDGEKRIHIAASLKNNRIVIKVSDSGPGVPINIKHKISDPFYSTKNGSTGIGLSICQRIISDHRGSMEVQTSKWGGAEFVIKIPV